MNNASIHIRVDSKTKKAAHKTFENLGLDTSTAIKMFLRKAVATNSIPFNVRTENGFTVAQEEKIIEGVKHAMKHGKRYASAEEAHRDILGNTYDDLINRG